MAKSAAAWKKGRGKLGVLAPLLGTWKTEADSPLGHIRCTRTFAPILGTAYVQLAVRWELPKGSYEELALYGVKAGTLTFWSFTSDGKHSQGTLADASEVHPQAIGFEADMPAGRARMVYWPDEAGGLFWAVESRTRKGWNRFTEHHYAPG